MASLDDALTDAVRALLDAAERDVPLDGPARGLLDQLRPSAATFDPDAEPGAGTLDSALEGVANRDRKSVV